MVAETVTLDEAVDLVADGDRLGTGGILLQRKPLRFLAALVDAGRTDLRLYTFLASLDAELLAGAGALAEAHTGYVGFEQLGFAPAYGAAVTEGRIRASEYTEFLFVAGLRASLAGLPFLPAKGGAGSQVLEELGYEDVTCPYTGTPLVAVPAITPDVSVIHAEAADPDGNVMGPADPDFLYDFDANIARAADRVVVSVERRVSAEKLREQSARTLLFGYEVDAVVELPDGAAPGSVPGLYQPDLERIRAYLDAAKTDPADRGSLVRELVGS